MTLDEFLADVRSEVAGQVGEGAPYEELVFCEVVMQHLADAGMTFEPVVCHYESRIGNSNLRLSGYAISEDGDQLDFFVSLYGGYEHAAMVPDSEAKTAAAQCLNFVEMCVNGKLEGKADPSSEAHALAVTVREVYNRLDQVRVFVLTDGVVKSKSFKPRDVGGRTVRLEVMDIERLFRHRSEGRPRDELVINFKDVSGAPLPCVFVPGEEGEYDYALTAIPGEALRFIYGKFGPRLLEANVRSFLSVKAKGVNAGIQSTLRNCPGRFMAFNNGIVLVVDEMRLDRTKDGSPGVVWLRGMQIVNGGQTTASIYFTHKKYPDTSLDNVRVPAKIIVIRSHDPARAEALVSDISRYANSQNVIRQSDLSANKPFHVNIERLSMSIYCPDGVGRWFYERAAGSYNTMLAREGTTPARRRELKEAMPTARRMTKTELAKYQMAWEGKPDIVCLGSQKCFVRFMDGLGEAEANGAPVVPDVAYFKAVVGKRLLFKATERAARPFVTAFMANVVAYTVAVVVRVWGNRFDFDKVWLRQGVSPQLAEQLAVWAREVSDRLHETSGGKMVSEWAKSPDCREAVFSKPFSSPLENVPEVRRG